MKKFLISIVLFLLTSTTVSALEIGSLAPDFTLADINGTPFQLSALRGQVVLLKLATTWCPSCNDQTAILVKSKELLREHNVAVVEVFLQDSGEMVRNYQQRNNLQASAVILDDDRVRKAYNVYLIPRVMLIDREFRVRRDGNLLTEAELKKALREITSSQEN